MPRQGFLKYQLPLYIYIGCIFAVSSIPDRSLPDMGSSSSERWVRNALAHFVEYGILCFLLFRFLQSRSRWSAKLSAVLSVLCAAGLGGIDEFYQGFTGRYPGFDDWLADCTGAVVCSVVLYILYMRTRKGARGESS